MQKTSFICKVTAGVFLTNLCLFGVKLYIGLATNSIAVFSDAVNNLSDSVSALLTAVCLALLLKSASLFGSRQMMKSEQLFTFLISVAVAFTGLYFAYSSIERFMYPTPVWYTLTYLFALAGTAAVKLALFFLLRPAAKKAGSPVLKAIAFDSLLDFFITAVTVLTLLLSSAGTFSFDALFGLGISIVITVSAVRLLLSSAGALTDHVPLQQRLRLKEIFEKAGAQPSRLELSRQADGVVVYAFFTVLPQQKDSIAAQVSEQTGMRLFCIEQQESETLS